MKNRFLTVILLTTIFTITLFSCSSEETHIVKEIVREKKDNTIDSLLLSREDSILADFPVDIWAVSDSVNPGDQDFKRQILLVEQEYYFNSNFAIGNNSEPNSIFTILYTGKPSPKSDSTLNHAYVIFIPKGQKLKSPMYIKSRGEIRLLFYEDNIDRILNQFGSYQGIMCWIGKFNNGVTYGDVHTFDKEYDKKGYYK